MGFGSNLSAPKCFIPKKMLKNTGAAVLVKHAVRVWYIGVLAIRLTSILNNQDYAASYNRNRIPTMRISFCPSPPDWVWRWSVAPAKWMASSPSQSVKHDDDRHIGFHSRRARTEIAADRIWARNAAIKTRSKMRNWTALALSLRLKLERDKIFLGALLSSSCCPFIYLFYLEWNRTA